MNGLWGSMVLKINFSWKSQEINYTWCIFYVGPIRWSWLNLTFSSLFSTQIWNARLLQRVALLRLLLDVFRNPKILHVTCHNLSQIDVTKTLCLFQAVIMEPTYHLKYCSKLYTINQLLEINLISNITLLIVKVIDLMVPFDMTLQ